MDPGALFAVHSWRDERGREPADFAPDAPANRLYLDYYAEMGMNADEARAFLRDDQFGAACRCIVARGPRHGALGCARWCTARPPRAAA